MNVSHGIPEYEIIAPNEAIISWKNDSITQQVLAIVEAEQIESAIRMGNGETLGEDVVQTTARGVGYIEGLKFLTDLLELTMVVEKKEDKDDGNKKGKKSS